MKRNAKISSFFKKEQVKPSTSPTGEENVPSVILSDGEDLDSRPKKVSRIETKTISTNPIIPVGSSIVDVERDPGKRKMIWEYPPNERDKIRRAYLMHGPLQSIPPLDHVDKNGRKFLPCWYKLHPDWLEYSPTTKKAYCLHCFLFGKPSSHPMANAFVDKGFNGWKKVNGVDCCFLAHVGNNPNSNHKIAVERGINLLNSLQHLDTCVEKHESKSVRRNRLRLKVSIDTAKLCAFQGLSLRGHNESSESKNRGNFLEVVQLLASYNDDVKETVLENAPGNASYASHHIQNEILTLYGKDIQKHIREEIGDGKFCIIVDESRDEAKQEQMAIVLRFVDKKGFVQERFFALVHVEDTKALTLKKHICKVLTHNNLRVEDIRGQGYDGASTMSGMWNGLQALFLNECPYAYYVHCFAHRLQLVLVATSRGIVPIDKFFARLVSIINMVG